MQLTIAAATALARAIRLRARVTPEIKWPNDILLGGRKVAGILTEMSAELDHVKFANMGIGVSVNLAAADFPPDVRKLATSLKLAAGEAVNRADLAAAILEELDRDYARIRGGQFEAVAEEWRRQCTTIGRNVTISIGSRRVAGRAEALDSDGALLLRTEHEHLERIVGGDVALEK